MKKEIQNALRQQPKTTKARGPIPRKGSEGEPVADLLRGEAADIAKGVKDLSDQQIALARQYETAGQDRVDVHQVLLDERRRRLEEADTEQPSPEKEKEAKAETPRETNPGQQAQKPAAGKGKKE